MLKGKKIIPLLLLLLAFALVPLSGSTYILLIACTIGIYIIAISGLDILFGYSGQISLGHAAFYAIGAYTSAILSTNYGVSVWFALFIGALVATAIAILIALPTVKLVHHFLALVTIAFGQLVYLFISNADKLTGGYTGIIFIPRPAIGSFSFDTNASFFYLIYFFVILFLIIKSRIVKSRIGRAFIAIRENAPAANGMGINVRRYKVIAFALSAFFAGFAGALYANFVNFISPESFMLTQSILFLSMLLFGGIGSLFGPIIGIIILTVATEYLQAIGNYQMLVYGLFLLVILLFLPQGIMRKIEPIVIRLQQKSLKKAVIENVEAK